ncbi:chlororespiratory reduction 7 [Tanacetum coccineum]
MVTVVWSRKYNDEFGAAASAVAVAANDTEEIVGNGLRSVVSSTKSFGGASTGFASSAGDQQYGSQTKPEESLSVSLPTDLSVENPPISDVVLCATTGTSLPHDLAISESIDDAVTSLVKSVCELEIDGDVHSVRWYDLLQNEDHSSNLLLQN